ncbi:MAG: undecaprenyl-phosphate galactose phosphotransferase WbaP [Planctomycetota bacterium]|nr:undecaprenyl-phosphate galactose phosphotransferase WbaP [Planctomycetota bacterium]
MASNLKYLLQSARTSLPLLASDQLALLGAVAIATWGIYQTGTSGGVAFPSLGLSLGCALLVAFAAGELYPGVGLPPLAEVRQCIACTSIVFMIFLLAARLYSPSSEVLIVLVAAWCICLPLIPLSRYLTRRFFCRFGWWKQPVVILGRGDEGRSLFESLVSNPALGLSPIGILDDIHGHWKGNGADAAEYLGPLEAASDISRQHAVYRAIVAMPERQNSEVHTILESSSEWFPHLMVIPSIQALPLLWTKTWHMGGYSGFQLRSRILLPLPQLIKRVIDLTAVITAGPLFVLLTMAIAAAIKYRSAGPVFYTQERIGRDGRRFRIWKFRTMITDSEEILDDYLKMHPELHVEWQQNRKLKDDPRIIPGVGNFLRKYSLDELPQLWNVLVGEMSLVGPRPLPDYHLDEFDDAFRRYREKLTPGLTGLWQVNCRSDGDPAMLVKWDRYYIRNWSFWLDLQILFRTVKVVFSGEGAY